MGWCSVCSILFAVFLYSELPMSPSMNKIYQRNQISLVPKLLLFKIGYNFLSKRLQVRDYHPTITLSFKTNLLNAIKLLLTYHCQCHGTFQSYSIAPFHLIESTATVSTNNSNNFCALCLKWCIELFTNIGEICSFHFVSFPSQITVSQWWW